MNAALEERSPVAAASSEAEIQPPLAAISPPIVVLDEAIIARAMTEAEVSGQPARGILSRLSGLSGAAYAQALAGAFDYRFVAGDELAHLEPDFSMLAPAEATRRHCLIFHEGPRLLAVFADPCLGPFGGVDQPLYLEELCTGLGDGLGSPTVRSGGG